MTSPQNKHMHIVYNPSVHLFSDLLVSVLLVLVLNLHGEQANAAACMAVQLSVPVHISMQLLRN